MPFYDNFQNAPLPILHMTGLFFSSAFRIALFRASDITGFQPQVMHEELLSHSMLWQNLHSPVRCVLCRLYFESISSIIDYPLYES